MIMYTSFLLKTDYFMNRKQVAKFRKKIVLKGHE